MMALMAMPAMAPELSFEGVIGAIVVVLLLSGDMRVPFAFPGHVSDVVFVLVELVSVEDRAARRSSMGRGA